MTGKLSSYTKNVEFQNWMRTVKERKLSGDLTYDNRCKHFKENIKQLNLMEY